MATLEETPKNATHWSRSSMAGKSGLSRSTIGRIWRDFGLKPHLTDASCRQARCSWNRSLMSPAFTTTRVRRAALTIRVEVRNLHRRPYRSRAAGAGGSLIREVPGRAGAALTKPGRASTARWCGSGERDGEEYARNQRDYAPRKVNQLKSGGYGPGAVRTRPIRGRGTSGQASGCRPGRPR